ncbi:prephenate/arogenate dehydrogenase [Oscillatoria sp. FACHB-1407]|uniref:prephenate/arogenate dehydrogenase n=1 Tax=Oscillatoria sp. FACHB-1407 TaxID=2692847 RepID=UPI0016836BDD|nr:prephenate/arogenate dehydrogenase [Oscillatoria sp. FACHB-1407]MBD2464956.1 prephenate/arogenate dehydrogenase [Oscillatoria sp. FACHB-1407]
MKIGIVGLGLIGGSIALDLRQLPGYTLLGVSRRPETCQQAVARGVVDDASTEFALLSAADVVFLCPPLGAIAQTVEALLPHLTPKTVLTDVGSVKQPIVEAIAPLWKNFVGGHPMAGTADSGLDAAQKDLFVNRAYVLTPIDTTPPEAVETVAGIARSLRAHVYQCDPSAHDQAVAWISHLPVMVSSSLIAACLQESDATILELAKTFASSGFRDTSRVGGGNPELGLMMAKYNQQALLRSLQTYRNQLDHTIALIEQADWNALETRLQQTQQTRPSFVD